jgi:hypothetical protein
MPHPREPDDPDYVKDTHYEKTPKGAPPTPDSDPPNFDPLVCTHLPEFGTPNLPRTVNNASLADIFDQLLPPHTIDLLVKWSNKNYDLNPPKKPSSSLK